MRKYKLTIIVIFFVMLLIPIVFINLKDNQISEIDNTKLLDISDVNSVSTLEKYIDKRLGLRSDIINAYNIVNDKLFHEMKHPTYEYGKDDYVFFKMKNEYDDYQYLDTYATMIKKMQDYVKDRGSYFLFVLNPTKVSLYSEYLPEGYHLNNIRIQYLEKKFNELGVNYLDNEEFLRLKKEERMVFNKQYDAGHWNEYGAFYGISNIYSRIKKDGVNISNISMDDYTITQKHETKLPVSEYPISEDVPFFSLKNIDYKINKIENIDINDVYNHKTKSTNANKTKTLLLFRGSYFGNKEKFVANNFKEAILISNYYNAINFDYYYNLSNFPDIVIMDAVEYSIGESYYPSDKINSKEYNPKYDSVDSLPNEEFTKVELSVLINPENGGFDSIMFENDDVKYAYLKVNNKIYDFSKQDSKFILSLEHDILAKSKVQLLLINNNISKKYEFNISY